MLGALAEAFAVDMSPIVVETLLSMLLTLPSPKHKTLYYYCLLIDMCKLLPTVPPQLERALNTLFNRLPQVAAALLAASRRASDAPPQLALPAALRPALEVELGRLGRCGGWRAALPWRRRRRLQLVRLRSFWPHFSAELLGELLRMDEARAHVASALTLDLLELRCAAGGVRSTM